MRAGVALTGLTHEWQTWNNCGPATLAMALSYHDVGVGQADIGPVLRPNGEDKNVSPHELADYARAVGLDATVRVNGDAAAVKTLLANGVAVIVEVWLEPEPGDGFGHYRLLTGYDNDAEVWTAYDSYVAEGLVDAGGAYAGITVPYAQLEAQWRVFNRVFVALYTPEQGEAVRFALGDLADDGLMYASTLARAQRELEANGGDAFAWFNRGSALVGLARYEEAVAAYEQAFAIGLPWRMLWYQFGPLEAYARTGRYAELVARVETALATTGDVEELHDRRGVGLAGLGDGDGACAAWATAAALRPDFAEAVGALAGIGEAE